MGQLPIPKGWNILISKPSWRFKGPFGYHFPNQQHIEVYPPKWAWFLEGLILRHELGHAWGIRGCNKMYCLMFEAREWKSKWKDVWWEKPLAMFFGLFNGYRFCKQHREQIAEAIKNEG